MNTFKRLTAVRAGAMVCLAAFATACATAGPTTEPPIEPAVHWHRVSAPPEHVILISIDGLRASDVSTDATPTLSRLASEGATGPMRPAFPSLTFPNHWTLVTGLTPDHHGIVANSFNDPRLGAFHMTETGEAFWRGAEPIWASAEKAGVRTATMFWPGSETTLAGVRPSFWRPFDRDIPDLDRTRQVLAWLDEPAATRPKLITLYFNAVDRAGHRHGPDAPETRLAIAAVDQAVGELRRGLEARGLADRTLLVVVSDHGMAATSADRVVWLDDLVDPAALRIVYSGALLMADPLPGRETEVEAKLIGRHPNMECWTKDRIPARFRYGSHPRVPRLLCLLDSGWLVSTRAHAMTRYGGAHGYDPETPDMQAAFIARGPGVIPGRQLDALDAVDIQPFLARMLGIPAPVGDGDPEDTLPATRP